MGYKPHLSTSITRIDEDDPDSPDDGSLMVARLNVEWTTLNALRETLSLALKLSVTPSYEQALLLGKTLSPRLFDSEESLLGKGREPERVLEYRQRAEAQSMLEGREIDPGEIIDKEIEHLVRLIETSSRPLIKKRLSNLCEIRRQLLSREYSENQIILRDLFKAERDIPSPPIDTDRYREYRLSDERGLRIRLLHPDIPEKSTGADLLYEHYWDAMRLARVVFIQYKIWNRGTLYLSRIKNLESQMKRLKRSFCDNGLCDADKDGVTRGYRFPFCAAFLRPTEKLQNPDTRLLSRGLYVPICAAFEACETTGRGGKKIEGKNIKSQSISHKIFEEIFNTNMLGSRWLTYEEVEQLYRKHKILRRDERIVIHAQEFDIK